ncbi:MAG: YtxH domain-containing protein [Longimicrobiales bacterium]
MMDEEESMMDEDHVAHSVTIVSVFLLGALVGAGIALLTAPEAGNRTRKRIRRVAGELKESASDHWDDLATDVKDKVDDAVRGARKRFVVKRDA